MYLCYLIIRSQRARDKKIPRVALTSMRATYSRLKLPVGLLADPLKSKSNARTKQNLWLATLTDTPLVYRALLGLFSSNHFSFLKGKSIITFATLVVTDCGIQLFWKMHDTCTC